jgi:hypothetical protein
MAISDIALVVFLGLFVLVSIGGILYFMNKEEH